MNKKYKIKIKKKKNFIIYQSTKKIFFQNFSKKISKNHFFRKISTKLKIKAEEKIIYLKTHKNQKK